MHHLGMVLSSSLELPTTHPTSNPDIRCYACACEAVVFVVTPGGPTPDWVLCSGKGSGFFWQPWDQARCLCHKIVFSLGEEAVSRGPLKLSENIREVWGVRVHLSPSSLPEIQLLLTWWWLSLRQSPLSDELTPPWLLLWREPDIHQMLGTFIAVSFQAHLGVSKARVS